MTGRYLWGVGVNLESGSYGRPEVSNPTKFKPDYKECFEQEIENYIHAVKDWKENTKDGE